MYMNTQEVFFLNKIYKKISMFVIVIKNCFHKKLSANPKNDNPLIKKLFVP